MAEHQLHNFIRSKITSMETGPESEEPFYVLDLGLAKSLMDQWRTKLPNITPFYAVKCNPEPTFVAALAQLGAGFDCASQSEIELVIGLGVSPDKIVMANTIKPNTHIWYAASVGANLATYDSIHEVEKIKKWHPQCALILRILAGDADCTKGAIDTKFGALPQEFGPLLEAAHKASLPVVGVSFHVGSTVTNPEAYRTAIATARAAFDTAVQLGMPRMHLLDIGGGFLADTALFDDIVVVIREALEFYFGNEPGLRVISEPGRFFAEKPFILVANITGKRVRGNLREYWVNDGIHGSMSIMRQEPDRVIPVKPLAYISYPHNPTCDGITTHASTVYGPTCDSRDTLFTNYQLPELTVNDRLLFLHMGADTSSAGSRFNGFDTSAIQTYIMK